MSADATHMPQLDTKPSHGRRFFALPHTSLGKWSVALFAVFWFFLAAFYSLAFNDVGAGGDTIADWPLWATFIPAALCGIAAAVTGWIAVLRQRERSLLVFLAVAWGTFVTWFVSMEVLFPH